MGSILNGKRQLSCRVCRREKQSKEMYVFNMPLLGRTDKGSRTRTCGLSRIGQGAKGNKALMAHLGPQRGKSQATNGLEYHGVSVLVA